MSARTKASEWIVVWSLKDWEGRPVGVNFFDIEAELPLLQLPCSQSTRGQARHASKLAAWENFDGTSEVGHQELPG